MKHRISESHNLGYKILPKVLKYHHSICCVYLWNWIWNLFDPYSTPLPPDQLSGAIVYAFIEKKKHAYYINHYEEQNKSIYRIRHEKENLPISIWLCSFQKGWLNLIQLIFDIWYQNWRFHWYPKNFPLLSRNISPGYDNTLAWNITRTNFNPKRNSLKNQILLVDYYLTTNSNNIETSKWQ